MFILLAESSITTTEGSCLQVSNTDQSTLWHYRYGHLSYKDLRILKHKNMVGGLPQIVDLSITCEACIKGKQHQTPIPKCSQWRVTKKLGLVHANLCGSITLPSSSRRRRYVFCFIDIFLGRHGYTFFPKKNQKYFTILYVSNYRWKKKLECP